MSLPEEYLTEAIKLARDNVRQGGRPFGAMIVRDGEIVATGVNHTAATNDPTAHAELVAIREASGSLATSDLTGCVIYASGQPCPMCLAAMYMSGIREVYYAYSNADGEPFGLSSASAYADLNWLDGARAINIRYLPVRQPGELEPYKLWREV